MNNTHRYTRYTEQYTIFFVSTRNTHSRGEIVMNRVSGKGLIRISGRISDILQNMRPSAKFCIRPDTGCKKGRIAGPS